MYPYFNYVHTFMDLFSFDLTEKFNFDEEYWSLTRILQYIIVSNNTFTNKIDRGASAIEELANKLETIK